MFADMISSQYKVLVDGAVPVSAPLGLPFQMDEEGAAAAVVSTLRGATEAGDWPLAGEAAWALELMGGMSRRLASGIG